MSDGAEAYSLVLGAGGRPGLAFHAGTLLALDLHGIRAGEATTLTGTSIGSVVTAIVAAGADAEDLAAYTAGASPRDEFKVTEAMIRAAEASRMRLDLRALGQLADVRRTLSAMSHLRAGRIPAALVALVPGLLQISRRFSYLDTMSLASGPGPAWRIVAATAAGQRHVFRKGDAALSLAVAASCAVPALFAPVEHNGLRLVDGGIYSTTNADLAADDAASTVIVIAPMCPRRRGHGPVTSAASTSLSREAAVLEAAGKRVVEFRPSLQLRQQMGWNPLSRRRSRDITAAAFLEASEVLADITPVRRRPLPAAVAS